MLGGVTGKAGDSLPMSIGLPGARATDHWERGRPARIEREARTDLQDLFRISPKPGAAEGPISRFFTQSGFHWIVFNVSESPLIVLCMKNVAVEIVVHPELTCAA